MINQEVFIDAIIILPFFDENPEIPKAENFKENRIFQYTVNKANNNYEDIKMLNLSSRATSTLVNNRITTISKLIKMDYDKLWQYKNFGAKRVIEILEKITKLLEAGVTININSDELMIQLNELYNSIPAHRHENLLCHYFESIQEEKAEWIKKILSTYVNQNTKTSDLKNIFGEAAKDPMVKVAIIVLLQLLVTDIKQLFEFHMIKLRTETERSYNVLKKRSNGYTLDSIGIEMGLSRERVRQIEKHILRTIRSMFIRDGIKPIMYIFADRNGKSVLTIDELWKYCKGFKEADTFIYYLKKNSGSVFIYDLERELFYLKEVDNSFIQLHI